MMRIVVVSSDVFGLACYELQELQKFRYSQTGLPDDGAKRAALEIAAVHRHGDSCAPDRAYE
jgi:hypothetical protein